MESSETKSSDGMRKPKFLLFILNRNGLEENDMRVVLSLLADTKYGASDVEVLWMSIFGKLPDRPHVLCTLSDDDVAREMANQTLHITYQGKDCVFEISEAFGVDPNEDKDEDPHTLFVSNVPVNLSEEVLKKQLLEYFSNLATPTKVIFPKSWQETRTVLLNFDNDECAKIVLKAAALCQFNGKLMKCSYARKLAPRSPPRESTVTKSSEPPKGTRKGKSKAPPRDMFIDSMKK
jgi:hypothetical protein